MATTSTATPTASKGWLEGTLDVIMTGGGGQQQNVVTPPPKQQQQQRRGSSNSEQRSGRSPSLMPYRLPSPMKRSTYASRSLSAPRARSFSATTTDDEDEQQPALVLSYDNDHDDDGIQQSPQQRAHVSGLAKARRPYHTAVATCGGLTDGLCGGGSGSGSGTPPPSASDYNNTNSQSSFAQQQRLRQLQLSHAKLLARNQELESQSQSQKQQKRNSNTSNTSNNNSQNSSSQNNNDATIWQLQKEISRHMSENRQLQEQITSLQAQQNLNLLKSYDEQSLTVSTMEQQSNNNNMVPITQRQWVEKEHEITQLKKQIDEFSSQNDYQQVLEKEQEIVQLQEQLEDMESTSKQQIADMQTQIENLEKEQARVVDDSLEMELDHKSSTENRDNVIAKLKKQCLDYSHQLAQLQKDKTTSKAMDVSNVTTDNSIISSSVPLQEEEEGEELPAADKKYYEKQIGQLKNTIKELQQQTKFLSSKSVTDQKKKMQKTKGSASTSSTKVQHDLEQALDVLSDKYTLVERQLLTSKLEIAKLEEEREVEIESHRENLQKKKDEHVRELQQATCRVQDLEQQLTESQNHVRALQETNNERTKQIETELKNQYTNQYNKDMMSKMNKLLKEISDKDQWIEDLTTKTRNNGGQQQHGMEVVHRSRSSSSQQQQQQQVNNTSARSEDIVQDTDEINEIEELRNELAARDEAVSKMTNQIVKLEKQIRILRKETRRNGSRSRNAAMPGGGGNNPVNRSSSDTSETETSLDESMDSESRSRRLLQERDDAIGKMVQRAAEQELLLKQLRQQIVGFQTQDKAWQGKERVFHGKEMKLRQQIDMLQNRIAEQAREKEDSLQQVEKLQQEAEVFAGQVIELDREIKQLRTVLTEREQQIDELDKELAAQKSSSNVQNLTAEIDELKEANATHLDELRTLRRKMWKAEAAPDEIAKAKNDARAAQEQAQDNQRSLEQLEQAKSQKEDELQAELLKKAAVEKELQEELAKVRQERDDTIASLNTQLDKSKKEFDELKATPSHMPAKEIEALQAEIRNLKQMDETHVADLDSARSSIRELEGMLAEKTADQAAAYEEEKEELLAEIETLSAQLEETRNRVQQFEADEGIVEEFKEKLERADEAREASEKSIIDNYERKLSLLTLDKDVTIDKLRNELISEKEASAEELAEVTDQLKQYQVEISELREEMTEQVGEREARIYALEHTLAAQEQLVNNMKVEMDHLQGSMVGTAARRKEEIDEMQQELVTMTAKAAKHEREIEALKVELDTKGANHQSEVEKLQSRIHVLESSPEELRNADDLKMELRVKAVKDRLEKLKWRNTALKEENLNLKERLEQAEVILNDQQGTAKLKELEKELAKQLKKNKQLESDLKSAREPPASGARAPPPPPPPPLPSSAKSKAPIPPSPKSKAPIPPSPSSQRERKSVPSSPARRLGIFGRKRANSHDSVPTEEASKGEK